MYKLGFYIPESHLEPVKHALFAAGAGRMGDYEHCCWQVLGNGQFRPMESANPHLGSPGKLEIVDEYRVELVVDDEFIKSVLQVLIETHPYEAPAYDVVRLETGLI